jgi:hypothetical protein
MLHLAAFPENALRGILKILHFILPRYDDVKSQRILRNIVEVLVKKFGEGVCKSYILVTADIASQQKSTPARYTCICDHDV